jgi:SPP1 gp7 family putative phage head morphogenesis protein
VFSDAYTAQQQRIVGQLADDPDTLDWTEEPQTMAATVLPFYEVTAAQAARQALSTLPAAADWGQVNQAVLKLAETEAARFGSQATATSQAQLSQVIADWIRVGGTMDELMGRAAAVWSGPRADIASATEVTRLYASGNQTAWRESGVVSHMIWATAADDAVCDICGPLDDTEVPFGGDIPPAHPGCRCWLTPNVRED